jgi:hypothetical protein
MRFLAAALIAGAFTTTANAQTGTAGRYEIGGGVRWIGGIAAGDSTATETRPNGSRLTLFDTDSRLGAAPGVDTHVGVWLTRALQIEGALWVRRPAVITEISADAEGIANAEAVEDLTEFVFEGALLLHPSWRIAGGVDPFFSAGAGYLRHLHDGRTLVEEGTTYFVGGGVTVAFTEQARLRRKGLGWRADIRAVATKGGAAFDNRAHVGIAVGTSLFVRF